MLALAVSYVPRVDSTVSLFRGTAVDEPRD